MKILLFTVVFIYFSFQTIDFVNKAGDYSFKVNNRAFYQKKTVDKGYLEIFTIKNFSNPKIADYILTVTKIVEPEADKFEFILLDEYINGFKEKCNCIVKEEKQKSYPNFDALNFEIKTTNKSGTFVGESVHFVKLGSIYNVMYLTTENLDSKFREEFKQTLNSMTVYK